jgi:hypothetical protein
VLVAVSFATPRGAGGGLTGAGAAASSFRSSGRTMRGVGPHSGGQPNGESAAIMHASASSAPASADAMGAGVTGSLAERRSPHAAAAATTAATAAKNPMRVLVTTRRA